MKGRNSLDFSNSRFLAVVVTVTLILDIYFYTGYYASDDISYLFTIKFFTLFSENDIQEYTRAINLIPNLSYNLSESISARRYGVVLPASLVYAVSGKTLYAVYGLFISIHLLLVILVHRFMHSVKDSEHAFFAALLTGFTPIFYVYAGAFFPDLFQTFYLFAAFCISWFALSKDGGRKYILISVSGFFFGLSYMSKVSSVVMFVPFFFMYLERYRTDIVSLIRSFAFFVLGFAVLAGMETVLNMYLTGMPFPRFTIVSGAKDLYLRKMEIDGTLPYERMMTAVNKFLSVYPKSYIITLTFGFFMALFAELKYKWTLFIFVLWPFMYLTFGSTSLSEYLPPSIQQRYYSLMMPWFVILALSGLMMILKKIKYRYVYIPAVFVLLVYLPVSSIGYNSYKAGLLYRAAQVQTFREAVIYTQQNYPEMPVILHSYLTVRMQHVAAVNSGNIRDISSVSARNGKFIYISPRHTKQQVTEDRFLLGNITSTKGYTVKHLHTIYPKTRFPVVANFFLGIINMHIPEKVTQKHRGMDVLLVELNEK